MLAKFLMALVPGYAKVENDIDRRRQNKNGSTKASGPLYLALMDITLDNVDHISVPYNSSDGTQFWFTSLVSLIIHFSSSALVDI